jgi:hypothetical protein
MLPIVTILEENLRRLRIELRAIAWKANPQLNVTITPAALCLRCEMGVFSKGT